ncbi:hypothetical protein [Streptomyces youssoufiensis]
MGRDSKRAKHAWRDKCRREDGLGMDGVPPVFRAAFVWVAAAWDRAIDTGLMADGSEWLGVSAVVRPCGREGGGLWRVVVCQRVEVVRIVECRNGSNGLAGKGRNNDG